MARKASKAGQASKVTAVVSLVIVLVFLMPIVMQMVGGCGGSPGGGGVKPPQEGVVYYLDDHLGNTHLMTDSNGKVLKEIKHHPYGAEVESAEGAEDVMVDYTYTGKELDEETGLVYFGNRYYSPEMGRWTTPDTLFIPRPDLIVTNPHEQNLYSYVLNNPLSNIDLNGDFACGGFCIGALALGAAAIKTAAIVKGVQYASEYSNGRPLGSTRGVNEALAIGAVVPMGTLALGGAAVSAPAAFSAMDAAYYAGSMKVFETATAITGSAPLVSTGVGITRDTISGLMPEAPTSPVGLIPSVISLNEDYTRAFGDSLFNEIGNTVKNQYDDSMFEILDDGLNKNGIDNVFSH